MRDDATAFTDLAFLESTYRIRDACQAKTSENLSFISHWDPDAFVADEIIRSLEINTDTLSPQAKYIYPRQLVQMEEFVSALGFDARKKSVLVTPCGTSSMNCIISFLKMAGIKKIFFIQPNYFSAYEVSRLYGIESIKIHVPQGQKLSDVFSVANHCLQTTGIWLTHPTYCTSSTLSAEDEKWLVELMNNGAHVIADECLALPGGELGRKIGGHDRFFGYYSPHKAFSLNDFKFSAVVFNKTLHLPFYRIADLHYGSLPPSCVSAFMHYMSDNFTAVSHCASNCRDRGRARLLSVIHEFPECTLHDANRDGVFQTISIKKLPSKLNADLLFIEALALDTALIILSGIWGGFDASFGFCFRVNLYKVNEESSRRLEHALEWLSAPLRQGDIR